jgi:heme/copper-type cytochrome/quinol oxidase subunit 2
MVNFIEMFLQLEPDDKAKCVDLVNNILFPIKFYIILIVVILFFIFCTNVYIITR